MAQNKWSYISHSGKQYIVGVFHGAKTGHLLIYINSKIVQIDFKVHEDALYSFFIDEELCEVSLTKKNGGFEYDFRVNREVDTPLNRHLKAFERVNRNRIIAMLLGLVIFVSLALAFGNYQKKKKEREKQMQLQELLTYRSISTKAVIDSVTWKGDDARFYYSFQDQEVWRSANVLIDKSRINLYTQGIPVKAGDEFTVKFNAYRDSSWLLLNEPSEAQLANFMFRAFEKEKQFNPHFSDGELQCRVRCAYEVNKLSGLADFYFQGQSKEDNPWHNELTYQKLTRDVPFQEALRKYCQPGD